MKNKIAVIGGDMRQIYMANLMAKNNHVYIYGNRHKALSRNVYMAASLKEAVEGAQFIVCPIPFSKDNQHIYRTNSDKNIPYMELFEYMTPDQLILSGPYKQDVLQYAKENHIQLFDIVEANEFAILNSVPTAEGVLSMMIEYSSITLAGSKCLVLGYGRCGSTLARLASRLNMDVYVASADEEELMIATINRCKTAKIQDGQLKVIDYVQGDTLEEGRVLQLESFNYVINTIPVVLLDIHINKQLEDYMFIDIANVYEDNNNKFINARGVPGKYSPKTAGKIITGVVIKEINDRLEHRRT
ncbi:hypothetical protein HZI73_12350 [Vallitalea pronyensis]|uniref:Dipicolinate synthase subunit A N-terminal domain-containing protein n=1 Tax=Vallitalea pronyensis TaxID=1348613 RepID=A0A8J8MK85_9FIRM|nr:dipicolinate synthase subunit DpsA [Vallitalea pronyensis]QUI23031.1 hypothetical protein HZI73_12350 [Vallitalea pronyensis]